MSGPCGSRLAAATRSATPFELECSDLLARCLQHETDHLDGVLFVDRLDPDARKLAMKAIRAADWYGQAAPTVKVSPHPMLGLGL